MFCLRTKKIIFKDALLSGGLVYEVLSPNKTQLAAFYGYSDVYFIALSNS